VSPRSRSWTHARRNELSRSRGFPNYWAERKAKLAERGFTPAQISGHPRRTSDEPVATRSAARSSRFPIIAKGGRFIPAVPMTRLEAGRDGRYFALLRAYERGDVTAAEFRRKVSRWRPVAGESLEPDADVALAVAQRMAPGDWHFDYRHGRAGRAA
jgi:hypothetical protein